MPDDPGGAELADGLARVVDRLEADRDGSAEVASQLKAAVEHLRAAARLGGLMPLVGCHHLRRALQLEESARRGELAALPGDLTASVALPPAGSAA